ncbi:DNA/RNA non-specific endonuclease [Sinomonas sp. G460-2]|uniref:DNA/RNA non-specific endonuclease n=1 Tax=Sinomonas sp. G460-2 TaxID=3393464 RepID=UPI0039EFE620
MATGADGVEAAWAGLPAAFESPEAPIVYGAMEPANQAARDFAGRLDAVSRTLDEYAERIRPIKADLASVRADAMAFVEEVGPDGLVWVNASETKRYEFDALATAGMGASGMVDGVAMGALLSPQDPVDYLISKGETARSGPAGPQILAPWHESGSYVDRNNRLLDRVADAFAKLSQAEADCADEINRQRTVSVAPVSRIESWELKLSGAGAVDLPWGQRAEEDRNCGESIWWGAGNSMNETVQGLGGLALGYDAQRDEFWRGEAYASSWKGFAVGIGSIALALNPLSPILGRMGVPVFKEVNDNVEAMAKSLVAWDTWGKNPGEALGMAAVGVGGFLLPGPGEAAGALKGASAASKLAKGSKTVEEAAQGGRTAEDAAAGAGKTVGHVAGSTEQRLAELEKAGPDAATRGRHASETLSDLGAHETRLDMGHGDAAPAHPEPDRVRGPGQQPEARAETSSVDQQQAVEAPPAGQPIHYRDHFTVPEQFARPEYRHEVSVSADVIKKPQTPISRQMNLQPNTLYHIEGRGDFYTGEHGKVVYVEGRYGTKGNRFWDLMKPEANVTYVIHPRVDAQLDGVSHAHVFLTDARSRVVRAYTEALSLGTGDRIPTAQASVGRQGGDEFEGGHVFADSTGGGGEKINLIAMLREVNRGIGDSFGNLEGEWRSALRSDPKFRIEVDIRIDYRETRTVPTGFDVWYSTNGKKPIVREFDNE